MDETMTLMTTVTPSLQRGVLVRGIIVAIAGISLWLYAGTQWPVDILQKWGWVFFLVGFLLIAAGLLPYRRCVNLQEHPHRLIFHERGDITYLIQENPVCMFRPPWIKRVAFYEKDLCYGIALVFHPENSAIFHSLWMKKRCEFYSKKYQCDLFLPYFQKRAFCELQEWL